MKIALITGASSGLGREFLYQANKWVYVDEVWVVSRSEKALKELELISSYKLKIIPLDLTKESSLLKLNELLTKEKPDIKLLINNAGYGKFGDFDKINIDDDYGMINLNVKAVVAITRYAIPYMAPGAKIIEVSSRASFQPIPYMATYAASKAFVRSYTESIYYELKAKGIRIMALCPSYVNTKFLSRADSKENDRVKYFGKIYEAKDIVNKCYKDLYKTNKIVSTYGKNVHFTRFLIRFVSTKTVLKTFIKSQRKQQPENMSREEK